MKLTITDITPEYDWVIVAMDGEKVFEGHAVPQDVWIDFLRTGGVEVEEKEVSAHALGMCGIDCPECE